MAVKVEQLGYGPTQTPTGTTIFTSNTEISLIVPDGQITGAQANLDIEVFDTNGAFLLRGNINEVTPGVGNNFLLGIVISNSQPITDTWPGSDTAAVAFNGQLKIQATTTVPTGENWGVYYALNRGIGNRISLRGKYTLNNVNYEWTAKGIDDGPFPEGTEIIAEGFTGEDVVLVLEDNT